MKGPYCIPFLILIFVWPWPINESAPTFRGLASSWDIIPSRSLAGLHYIFKGFELDENHGVVKVKGPVIEIINGKSFGAKVHEEGYTTEMDWEDFEEEQQLGHSVFEATTRIGTTVGTAFLVGNDIVLTNRHVMGYAPTSRNWDCGKFSIKLNHKDEKVNCERVRFCSANFDYCVIEVKKMKNGMSIGAEVRPLRLTNKVRSHQDTSILHIGNAAGMGIQASRGKGLKIEKGEFYHYAPTLGGSSGAPIFNEKGEVIGINWGLTGGSYIDEGSFNRGVLANTIFKELSKTHTRTLNDIKSFRFWFRSIHSHRQVKIEAISDKKFLTKTLPGKKITDK